MLRCTAKEQRGRSLKTIDQQNPKSVGARDPRIVGAQAVVFFGAQATLPWLRILRPGFRHCFVCIRWYHRWIIVDPMSNVLEVGLIEDMSEPELVSFYEQAGYRGVTTRLKDPGLSGTKWRLMTCVEVVKGALGIQEKWVYTPYKLYKYLEKDNRLDKGVKNC